MSLKKNRFMPLDVAFSTANFTSALFGNTKDTGKDVFVAADAGKVVCRLLIKLVLRADKRRSYTGKKLVQVDFVGRISRRTSVWLGRQGKHLALKRCHVYW